MSSSKMRDRCRQLELRAVDVVGAWAESGTRPNQESPYKLFTASFGPQRSSNHVVTNSERLVFESSIFCGLDNNRPTFVSRACPPMIAALSATT